MELIIKKHRTSLFLSKYSIFENTKLLYTAKAKVIAEKREIVLYDQHNHEIGKIKREESISPEFTIFFEGGFNSKVEGRRFPYNYLSLKVPTGTVEVHHQKGLRIAVFENESQIALIKRKRLNFFSTTRYLISANKETSQEFLTLLCIGWDVTNNYKINIIPTYFGYWGMVKRKEVIDWKPNNEKQFVTMPKTSG